MEELNKFPEKYTVHQLYESYPDEIIDFKKEQELIEAYDKIIFQFPFYWFSSTPLLKKWLDEVLLHGWAYGSKSGFKVSGKKIALAISTGIVYYGLEHDPSLEWIEKSVPQYLDFIDDL